MSRLSESLTGKQSKALEFIFKSLTYSGTAPTLRELCSFMGYSAIGSAQDIVTALRKKGFLLQPEKQSARSLILSDKALSQFELKVDSSDANTFSIHCLGAVPAGNPLESVEERIGTLRMSISMFQKPFPNPDKLFALKASGDSMIEAGIFDGDWLVVHNQKEANSGDIVVARFGDNSTVKRLMKNTQGWYLKPENKTLKNIYASVDEPFEIVGKVMALQRTI